MTMTKECIALDWDNITIIDKDVDSISRKVKEALHIRMNNDLMNRDSGVDISHMWDSLLKI